MKFIFSIYLYHVKQDYDASYIHNFILLTLVFKIINVVMEKFQVGPKVVAIIIVPQEKGLCR